MFEPRFGGKTSDSRMQESSDSDPNSTFGRKEESSTQVPGSTRVASPEGAQIDIEESKQ